jgi:hypothetical protein
MATLATIFARFSGSEIPMVDAATASGRDGGTRIRPFANEDIYFYAKHIDNSSVIRAVDPASERASWKMIGTAAMAAIFLIMVLVPKGYGVLDGYKMQTLREEQHKLVGERDALDLEEASLMSPERMAVLAKQQQFVDPTSDRIVYLDGVRDAEMAATPDLSGSDPSK